MRNARRPSRLLAALLVSCGLALAASPAALAGACESATATPAQAGNSTVVRATLCTINAERARQGLAPLRLNARLSAAAAGHAGDMDRRNYFAHDSLGGGSFVDRIRRAGYLRGARGWTVGENIAWASRGRAAPVTITQMWMNSPSHRANILNGSFREIGIGVAHGSPVGGDTPAAIYATDFGAKS